MRNRKRTHPYLIYSFIIHFAILIGVWWLSPKNLPLPDVNPSFFVEAIFEVPRPVVAPPKEIEEPPPAEPVAPPVPAVESPPALAKPKSEMDTEWLTVNNEMTLAARDREIAPTKKTDPEIAPTKRPEVRGEEKIGPPRNPNNIAARRSVPTTLTPSISQEVLALPTASEALQAEVNPIVLNTDNALKDNSPTVGTPKVRYGSRRGDAFQATAIGNSWGGGSSSGNPNTGGIYVTMMKDIAREIVAAATTKKVDVVFVLDETASMIDNLRGIRAYLGDFLMETFEREKHEAAFGLVTFTDKAKMHGQTTDFGTFKNWLFKINVDGGGDISEAGLDALMTAVAAMKFRHGAQRFFILASDSSFHDADYDGKSVYSLDNVIETLQSEKIRVDVIGLDYLPIKQIAKATGGTWRAIPGRGYLEYIPPLTLTVKMLSKLGTLSVDGSNVGDKITVHLNKTARPKQLTLTWKVLNPRGERCHGPFTEKRNIPNDASTVLELTPELDKAAFQTIPGIYTVIYRLENELGHQSILRRTLKY